MKSVRRQEKHWLHVKSLLDLHFALTCRQFMVLVDEKGVIWAKWKRLKK